MGLLEQTYISDIKILYFGYMTKIILDIIVISTQTVGGVSLLSVIFADMILLGSGTAKHYIACMFFTL